MDFLDPKKKRAHRIRLFIGYGLTAVLIAIGATILLFEAHGYDFNPHTGEVIQNGLVFVDAHPEAADVYLNGVRQGRTDTRLVIPEGEHHIEVRRSGYHVWQRRFQLSGGSIERLVYPFLFPERLESETAYSYEAVPQLITQSPDKRWLIVHTAETPNSFLVTDLNKPTVSTATINVPPELLTPGTTHRWKVVEWSTNNRHVLLKHTHPGGREFIVLDRANPAASTNLNHSFTVDFSEVRLWDKRPDQFYLFHKAGGRLYQASSRSGEVRLLLRNVIDYRAYGNHLLMFITKDQAKTGNVSVMLREDGESYKLRELPDNTSYLFELVRFDGKLFAAMGAVTEGRIHLYRDPLLVLRRPGSVLSIPVPIAVLRLDSPEFLSISPSARFLAVQAGDQLAVYDFEMDKTYEYNASLGLKAGQPLQWMDGYRLATTQTQKVIVMDYDGINKRELVAAHRGTSPFLDPERRRLFTASPVAGDFKQAVLLMTDMRIAQARS